MDAWMYHAVIVDCVVHLGFRQVNCQDNPPFIPEECRVERYHGYALHNFDPK